MISALEIGFALSLVAAVVALVSLQPRPKPVCIRAKTGLGHAQPRRRPHA